MTDCEAFETWSKTQGAPGIPVNAYDWKLWQAALAWKAEQSQPAAEPVVREGCLGDDGSLDEQAPPELSEEALQAGQEVLFDYLPEYTIQEREDICAEIFSAVLKAQKEPT